MRTWSGKSRIVGVFAPCSPGGNRAQDDGMSLPLVELAEAQLTGVDGWSLRTDDFWCHVQSPDTQLRGQGWKLHVSATVGSAPDVLLGVFKVLVSAGCTFKFARSIDKLRELNNGHAARGGSGKFVTVYPADDHQFRELAEQLHEATSGLDGPTILSDRPYVPGSLVHYRYGAFIGEQVLTNDGQFRQVITAPDGSKQEDSRDAWFNPPEWAPLPFPEADPPKVEEVDGVLLADRFVVQLALRHANKGGVFEAVDRVTGNEVVIKQARAGVGGEEDGWDLQAALRNEAEMLDLLEPLGVTPRRIALFDQDGDLFLVQERVAGMTLRAWRTEQPVILSWLEMAEKLVDLLGSIHSLDIVVRDLSPLNVMVADDGRLVLIDLEFATRTGSLGIAGGTPGYVAPEQSAKLPAAQSADLHALGGLVFLLCTGADPILPADEPAEEERPDRVVRWLAQIAETNQAAAAAFRMVQGLLSDSPANRWTLDQVRGFLADAKAFDGLSPVAKRSARSSRDLNELLANGIDHLVTTMTPQSEKRLWAPSLYGDNSDVCSVYHGAGGGLATLTWVGQQTHDERVL